MRVSPETQQHTLQAAGKRAYSCCDARGAAHHGCRHALGAPQPTCRRCQRRCLAGELLIWCAFIPFTTLMTHKTPAPAGRHAGRCRACPWRTGRRGWAKLHGAPRVAQPRYPPGWCASASYTSTLCVFMPFLTLLSPQGLQRFPLQDRDGGVRHLFVLVGANSTQSHPDPTPPPPRGQRLAVYELLASTLVQTGDSTEPKAMEEICRHILADIQQSDPAIRSQVCSFTNQQRSNSSAQRNIHPTLLPPPNKQVVSASDAKQIDMLRPGAKRKRGAGKSEAAGSEAVGFSKLSAPPLNAVAHAALTALQHVLCEGAASVPAATRKEVDAFLLATALGFGAVNFPPYIDPRFGQTIITRFRQCVSFHSRQFWTAAVPLCTSACCGPASAHPAHMLQRWPLRFVPSAPVCRTHQPR